jgi:hypothetical protein
MNSMMHHITNTGMMIVILSNLRANMTLARFSS